MSKCTLPQIGAAFLALTFATIAAPTVWAQTPPPAAPAVKTNPADEWYGEGTRLLAQGKNFAQAVSLLSQAVQKEPTNSDYVLALGAAYTSRAAVLGRAILAAKKYQADTKRYQAAKIKWLAAQKDPESPAYGWPKPEPIAPPRTEDDRRLFKMEVADAEAQVKALSLQAWQTLDKGVVLRDADEAPRRAEALNLQGWCRMLLYLDAQYAVKEAWPPNQTDADGKQKFMAAKDAGKNREALFFGPLEQAAALVPNEVSYQRSLGDAYAFMGGNPHSMNPPWRKKGADILTNVLEKTPNDAILRLRISQLSGMHSSTGGTTGPIALIDVMKQAVDSDPSNAFLWYSLFAAAGDAHDYKTAMSALKSGGSAPSFHPMRYTNLLPKMLAWAFPPLSLSPRWQILSGLHYISFVVFADPKNPTADAVSFQHGVLVMAQRYKKALREKLTDEESTMLEKGLFYSYSYAVSQATLLKDFSQNSDDKQLLAEAQEYTTTNDAGLAAEETLGTQNLYP